MRFMQEFKDSLEQFLVAEYSIFPHVEEVILANSLGKREVLFRMMRAHSDLT